MKQQQQQQQQAAAAASRSTSRPGSKSNLITDLRFNIRDELWAAAGLPRHGAMSD
jgi:hypothetical protein